MVPSSSDLVPSDSSAWDEIEYKEHLHLRAPSYLAVSQIKSASLAKVLKSRTLSVTYIFKYLSLFIYSTNKRNFHQGNLGL